VLIEAAQAVFREKRCLPGSDPKRNGHRSRIRTVAWTHFASPPRRPRAHRGGLHGAQRDEAEPADEAGSPHPSSTELWHCTAYPEISGSHLGSTLKPGGAVLTLGVFRRSRSSGLYPLQTPSPSEVACKSHSFHQNSEGVNLARGPNERAELYPAKRVGGRVEQTPTAGGLVAD